MWFNPAVNIRASLVAQFVISTIVNFLRESRDLSRSFHCFKQDSRRKPLPPNGYTKVCGRGGRTTRRRCIVPAGQASHLMCANYWFSPAARIRRTMIARRATRAKDERQRQNCGNGESRKVHACTRHLDVWSCLMWPRCVLAASSSFSHLSVAGSGETWRVTN